MKILSYAAAALCIVLAALVVAVLVSRYRFRALIAGEAGGLLAGAATSVGAEQVAARWSGLPAPVQRYLRFAISPSAPAIRTLRLQHTGSIRTGPGGPWLPLEGAEFFAVAEPGFVWHGVAHAAPLTWIEVRDHLLAGRGSMLVKLESTLTLADAQGAEIDQGARMRWLAEAMWFPYALVGDRIHWEALSDRSARAMLLQPGHPVSLVFEFDGEGKLLRMEGERYRDLGGGTSELARWQGECADYREFDGLRVPTSARVSWLLKDGPFEYFRIQVTDLEYNASSPY